MSVSRQSYVKPLVMQMQYMSDPHVSIAAPCKQEGAASGMTPSSCNNSGQSVPCSAVGS